MNETRNNNNSNNNNNTVLVFSDEFNRINGYNTSELNIYGLDENSRVNLLYGLMTLSVFTIIANIWVLKCSNTPRIGQSTILVFIRSLCVSDILIGLFGVFKSFQLQNLDKVLFNCFLPESIFVSATTAACLTFLWLNTETYLHLAKPFCSIMRMDKHNTTAATILLWNVSLILGFLPQMGWNNEKFTCNMFLFYKAPYIACVSSVWLIGLFGCSYYQVLLHRTRVKIKQNRNFLSSNSLEFKQYNHLCIMLYNDIIIFTLCYLPCVTYIIFYSINDRHKKDVMVNINLVFFLPLFIVRSFLTALIHRYRTVQIQRLMCAVSRAISTSRSGANITESDDTLSLSNVPDINDLIINSNTSTVYTINGRTILPTGQAHQPLSAQASTITTVTEEEEISGTNL